MLKHNNLYTLRQRVFVFIDDSFSVKNSKVLFKNDYVIFLQNVTFNDNYIKVLSKLGIIYVEKIYIESCQNENFKAWRRMFVSFFIRYDMLSRFNARRYH